MSKPSTPIGDGGLLTDPRLYFEKRESAIARAEGTCCAAPCGGSGRPTEGPMTSPLEHRASSKPKALLRTAGNSQGEATSTRPEPTRQATEKRTRCVQTRTGGEESAGLGPAYGPFCPTVRFCKDCGAEFLAKKRKAGFCSTACRMRFHTRRLKQERAARAAEVERAVRVEELTERPGAARLTENSGKAAVKIPGGSHRARPATCDYEAIGSKPRTIGKAYISERWPSPSIGDSIKFESGVYVNKDDDEEKLIESRDYYGIHVHDRDTLEEIEIQRQGEAEALEDPFLTSRGRGGRRRRAPENHEKESP